MAQEVEHFLGKDKTSKKHLFLITIKTFKLALAAMAQEVEHFLGKEEVTGSNPVSSSTKTTIYGGFFILLNTKYR